MITTPKPGDFFFFLYINIMLSDERRNVKKKKKRNWKSVYSIPTFFLLYPKRSWRTTKKTRFFPNEFYSRLKNVSVSGFHFSVRSNHKLGDQFSASAARETIFYIIQIFMGFF